MSKELKAHKGSYVIIAYWDFKTASEFVKKISKEFETEVMHMAWDEEINEVQCQIWLDGQPALEECDNPIGRIISTVS